MRHAKSLLASLCVLRMPGPPAGFAAGQTLDSNGFSLDEAFQGKVSRPAGPIPDQVPGKLP
ncbi:MAG: hypothetical protein ABSH40_16530 [Bryobacteraceae bacterium]|jgi:hypothetical protein